MLWRSKSALMQKAIVELVDATNAEINFIHGLINNESNILNYDNFIVSDNDIKAIQDLLVACIENKADKNTFNSLVELYSKKVLPFSLYSVFSNLITDENKKTELQTSTPSRPLNKKLQNLQELYSQKFSFYDNIILPIKNVFNWIMTKTINFILRREEPVLNSNVQQQLKAKIAELSNVTPAKKHTPNYAAVAGKHDAGLINSNINKNTQNNSFGQSKKNDVENSKKKKKRSFGMSGRCTIS